ncbi:MAG: DEAD/DEAH box helicase [Aureispira sp.]
MSNLPLTSYLQRLGIDKLNPMQLSFMETAILQKDVLLHSPTGSGKTLAFLLGVLEQLQDTSTPATQVLILAPSRELALQIDQVFRSLQTGHKINCCYGGHPIAIELKNLQTPPTVLVGTPGRIADHLRRGSITTESISHLVLDEFDKSLELGFEKDMAAIVEALPQVKQHFLTSATNAVALPEFLVLQDPIHLDFSTKRPVDEGLGIKAILTKGKQRKEDFLRLVQWVGREATLIFCNQKAIISQVSDWLDQLNITHGTFHGDLEQKDRELALIRFRNGSHNILVTTDLAARGLDIPSIKHIIHYQLPHSEPEFIHRNGRTARMEATGTAYVLLEEDKPWREYLDERLEYIELPTEIAPLPPPTWETLYISAGKKNKINKFDLVGALFKKGGLNKDELGLVVVKEYRSYAAVRSNRVEQVIRNLHKKRIKKQQVVVELAR